MLNGVLFPVPVFITASVLHPKCSQRREGKRLSISGGTWPWDSSTNAVVCVVLTVPIQRAKLFLIYPGTLSTLPLFSWYD